MPSAKTEAPCFGLVFSLLPQQFFGHDSVRAGFARLFGVSVGFSIFSSGYEDYKFS